MQHFIVDGADVVLVGILQSFRHRCPGSYVALRTYIPDLGI